jgi:hypothetical protein
MLRATLAASSVQCAAEEGRGARLMAEEKLRRWYCCMAAAVAKCAGSGAAVPGGTGEDDATRTSTKHPPSVVTRTHPLPPSTQNSRGW